MSLSKLEAYARTISTFNFLWDNREEQLDGHLLHQAPIHKKRADDVDRFIRDIMAEEQPKLRALTPLRELLLDFRSMYGSDLYTAFLFHMFASHLKSAMDQPKSSSLLTPRALEIMASTKVTLV